MTASAVRSEIASKQLGSPRRPAWDTQFLRQQVRVPQGQLPLPFCYLWEATVVRPMCSAALSSNDREVHVTWAGGSKSWHGCVLGSSILAVD